ncbi:MAG: hypothetical protein Kow0032_28090 [Methyloligellaceae bacterium]
MSAFAGIRCLASAAPVFIAAVVAGCGAPGNRSGPPAPQPVARQQSDSPATAPVTLNAEQLLAIKAGVTKMIPNPGSAKMTRARAMTIAGKPGIHVCGHVRYKGADGKLGAPQPYYLQLGEAEGKPVAERGQVGSDPAALAKVNFLCRERTPE